MMLINHQALKTQHNSIKTWQIPQITCNSTSHIYKKKNKKHTHRKRQMGQEGKISM